MADRQSACTSGRKRGPAAVEPPEYVGATKTCTTCGSAEHSVFKFLNNKKPDQPRYRCMRCNTWYTHYPPGKARTRAHGKKYDKHTLANPPEHAALFDLRCPMLACRAQNPAQVRFLYSNNNNPSQPRYRCVACQAAWQPKLKNLPPRLDEASITLQYHKLLQQSHNPQEWASLGSGDPNYTVMMQNQQQYYDPAMQVSSMGPCTENPNGAPTYMGAMQDAMHGEAHLNYMDQDLEQQLGGCTPDPSMRAGDGVGNLVEAPGEQPCVLPGEYYASSWFDVAADAVLLGGEQNALCPEFDPSSLEFHATDADTEQGAEQQDASEAEWGMGDWMVELFPSS